MAGLERVRGLIIAASMVSLGCGDDGNEADGPDPDSGSMPTLTVTGSSEGASGGSTDSTEISSDSTTGAEGGSSEAGSSGGDSTGDETTGGGSELGDPEVFRTPDEADVCGPTPEQPCTAGDMAWLAAEYGSELRRADAAWVDAHGAVYRLVAFVERLGPSNIDVFLIDEAGAPLAGIPVAFHYDSLEGPSRPDEWYPVKIEAATDAQGRAGFALGPSAYLDDCGGGGPHAIWVSEPGAMPDTTVASDLADRLGMLGGTDHRHLDLLFQRQGPQTEPSPGHCPLGG